MTREEVDAIVRQLDVEREAEEAALIATMTPEDERCKVGKCPYCGEIKDNLLPTQAGDLRCEECDSDYEWCSVCEEDQRYDDHCRHIFHSEWGEWFGSGAYELAGEHIRECFITLLDLMPQGFAQDLRRAILSGRFYTWAVLPIIGGGGLLELNGMPYRHGRYCVSWWGDFLMEIGSGDEAEETSDAYHWLASLYKSKTIAANGITVKWLDEYIALERAARIWGLPA